MPFHLADGRGPSWIRTKKYVASTHRQIRFQKAVLLRTGLESVSPLPEVPDPFTPGARRNTTTSTRQRRDRRGEQVITTSSRSAHHRSTSRGDHMRSTGSGRARVRVLRHTTRTAARRLVLRSTRHNHSVSASGRSRSDSIRGKSPVPVPSGATGSGGGGGRQHTPPALRMHAPCRGSSSQPPLSGEPLQVQGVGYWS